MTKEELERIKVAYHSGLKVQIWFNGNWKNFDAREYSMYKDPFSENRQYRIVGSDYADMAEKRIAELEAIVRNTKAVDESFAKLQLENTELKADNDARKFAMAMSEKVEKQLREENSKLKEEWQEQVQKATDEGYARTLQTIQLNNAKEIIRDLINLTEPTSTEEVQHWNETFRKAEQFIKDSEGEK